MKTLLLAFALLLTGCTITKVKVDPITREARVWRMSFLQKVDIPELVIQTTNGSSVTLRGYRNDGGGDAAAALMKAGMSGLAEGAMKGAKGGL